MGEDKVELTCQPDTGSAQRSLRSKYPDQSNYVSAPHMPRLWLLHGDQAIVVTATNHSFAGQLLKNSQVKSLIN